MVSPLTGISKKVSVILEQYPVLLFLQFPVFQWTIVPSSSGPGLFEPKDKGVKIFRNVGNCIPSGTTN
jgi:hypothetical protein